MGGCLLPGKLRHCRSAYQNAAKDAPSLADARWSAVPSSILRSTGKKQKNEIHGLTSQLRQTPQHRV
jgi:hypothetical protein